MAYDENDQPIKIPRNMLPVKLPEIEKLDNTGNPLDSEDKLEILYFRWKKIQKRNRHVGYFC